MATKTKKTEESKEVVETETKKKVAKSESAETKVETKDDKKAKLSKLLEKAKKLEGAVEEESKVDLKKKVKTKEGVEEEKEKEKKPAKKEESALDESKEEEKKKDDFTDILKTRTDSLDLSTRTLNALTGANIRTLGGLARKRREDLLEIEGIGEKGITEIKKVLTKFGLTLKE